MSVSVSKTFGLEKSLGIGLENICSRKKSRSQKFWSQKKVSVSVSKIFGLEKKSRYRSRKLWSQKSLDISLENFGFKKILSNDLEKLVLEKVVVLVSKTLDLVMV